MTIRAFPDVDALWAKIGILRHAGVISGGLSRPILGHGAPRATQEPLRIFQAPQETAQTPPSNATGNGIKALSCHIPATASAIHTTTLSVPLPGRFALTCLGKNLAKTWEKLRCWAFFGASWAKMGILRHLAAILGHLGAVLGTSWGLLGPSRGPCWGIPGPSWAILGVSWAIVGQSWGHPGPSWDHLGPCGGNLGLSWGQDAIFEGCPERLWGSSWAQSRFLRDVPSGCGGVGSRYWMILDDTG